MKCDCGQCNACFKFSIIRRAQAQLRNKKIKKGSKIFIENQNSLNGKIALKLLKSILKNLPLEFVSTKENANYIINPSSLDDELAIKLENVFAMKNINFNNDNEIKTIKPLIEISNKELIKFARMEKIRGKINTKKSIIKALDSIENKKAGVKRALIRSINDLF